MKGSSSNSAIYSGTPTSPLKLAKQHSRSETMHSISARCQSFHIAFRLVLVMKNYLIYPLLLSRKEKPAPRVTGSNKTVQLRNGGNCFYICLKPASPSVSILYMHVSCLDLAPDLRIIFSVLNFRSSPLRFLDFPTYLPDFS